MIQFGSLFVLPYSLLDGRNVQGLISEQLDLNAMNVQAFIEKSDKGLRTKNSQTNTRSASKRRELKCFQMDLHFGELSPCKAIPCLFEVKP